MLERCDRAAAPFVRGRSLSSCAPNRTLPDIGWPGIDVIQPVLVAVAIACAAWLESNGVHPDAVVGHSMQASGRGVSDQRSTLTRRCVSSAAAAASCGGRVDGRHGARRVVDDAARARIIGREAELSVAANNAPRSRGDSGRPDAVAR